jgi:hypothetical protein
MELNRPENPLAVESPQGHAAHDIEGGTLIMDAVAQLIAAERAAADAQLEEKLAQRDAGGIDAAIRRVFGTASAVPCNWHQATIFFASSDDPVDAAMRARSPLMLVAGLAVVVFQV